MYVGVLIFLARKIKIGDNVKKIIQVTFHVDKIHLHTVMWLYMHTFDKFVYQFAHSATCWIKIIQSYELLYVRCYLLKYLIGALSVASLRVCWIHWSGSKRVRIMLSLKYFLSTWIVAGLGKKIGSTSANAKRIWNQITLVLVLELVTTIFM